MESQCSNEYKIQPFWLSTHVKTVKFVSDLLLVGEGNKIHCYDWKRKKYLGTETVFNGTNSVHGIKILSEYTDEVKFIAFGGKSVRVYCLFRHLPQRFVPLTTEHCLDDWIHDVSRLHHPTNQNVVVVVTAHNSIVLWDWKEMKILEQHHCKEKCILYSAHILLPHHEAVVIAVGTVFKEIVIWSPYSKCDENVKKEPVHRLIGHQGVVFSITFNASLRLLCSTSDDRSLRLWKFHVPCEVNELSYNFNSLNFWLTGSFHLQNILYAHESRVWRSLILPNCIISIGEDSTICFWAHDGSLLQKEKCHNGGSIWCIDVNSELTLVATGGSNSGVLLWDINHVTCTSPLKTVSLHSTLSDDGDFPRNVLLLSKDDNHYILVTTNKGSILLYDLQREMWLSQYTDESFSSYCVPSVSPDNKLIFLGSLYGDISMFSFDECGLFHCKKQRIMNGKLNSIHWTDSKSEFILTCGQQGQMILWNVQDEDGDCDLLLVCYLCLPKNKYHWWSTVALFIEATDILVVGDRGGSIHVYTDVTKNPLSSAIKNPSIAYHCIHGKNGVTDIKQNGKFLCSSGRDGRLAVYMITAHGIHELHDIKVPNDMEWIGKLLIVEGNVILLGFHATDFIVWSSKHERTLMKVPCGGGHRSWDFSFASHCLSVFAAIKKKEIMICKQQLGFLIKESSLQLGISGMAFCCVCYLFTMKDLLHGEVPVLACGGEDPALKIIGLNCGKSSPFGVIYLQSIAGHLSSIRAIAKCEIAEESSWLIVSVGGRAQMIAWKVQCEDGIICEQLGKDFVWNVDKPHNKPWAEKHVKISDPQTRYMDVSVWHPKCSTEYFIATACSDSFVRLHAFNVEKRSFFPHAVLPYGEHCVLKMAVFQPIDQIRFFLATAATDGFLKVYNLLIPYHEANNVEHPPEPILHERLHQSGINALAIKHVANNCWLLCSGGDDNSISIILFSFDPHNQKGIVVASGTEDCAHASQITGMKILPNNLLLSVSIDQRLNLWHWKQSKEILKLKLVKSRMCYIADISNLEMWSCTNSEKSMAMICGEGLEVFQIDISPSSNLDKD